MSAIAALTLLADAATAMAPAPTPRLAGGATIVRPVAGDAPPPFEPLSGAPPFRQGATRDLRLAGGASDPDASRPIRQELPTT